MKKLVWRLGRVGRSVVFYVLIGAVCGVLVFVFVGGMGLARLGTAVGIGIVPMILLGIAMALAVMGIVNLMKKEV